MIKEASSFRFRLKRRYEMVASRQVVISFCRRNGRQRIGRLGPVAQVGGRTANPYQCRYVVLAGKRVGADLLELAEPEDADVVCGRKSFKTAGKIVGQWEYKLWENKWALVAAKDLQPKPFQDILQNYPVGSEETVLQTSLFNQTIFGTNFFWQLLETLQGNSQELTISCQLTNKKFILKPHSMKTAESSKFYRIGTFTLTLDNFTWFWKRNWSRAVVTRLTIPKKFKAAQGRIERGCRSTRNGEGGRQPASFGYSYKQLFAFRFSPMLKRTPTISKFRTLMDCLRTILTLLTTSRKTSLSTREFCTPKLMTMNNVLMRS